MRNDWPDPTITFDLQEDRFDAPARDFANRRAVVRRGARLFGHACGCRRQFGRRPQCHPLRAQPRLELRHPEAQPEDQGRRQARRGCMGHGEEAHQLLRSRSGRQLRALREHRSVRRLRRRYLYVGFHCYDEPRRNPRHHHRSRSHMPTTGRRVHTFGTSRMATGLRESARNQGDFAWQQRGRQLRHGVVFGGTAHRDGWTAGLRFPSAAFASPMPTRSHGASIFPQTPRATRGCRSAAFARQEAASARPQP